MWQNTIKTINSFIFKKIIQSSCYSDIWKKSNIIPVHKNSGEQLVKKCRAISLLPIFRKIFQKVIFNRIYKFLSEERLLGELYNPHESYPSVRLKRIVLNGKIYFWTLFLAHVSQGTIFGLLIFPIYVNYLHNDLKSNAKPFADDTSLVTIVQDKLESSNILKNDVLINL